MTNEEKARELSEKLYEGTVSYISKRDLFSYLMSMAEWKEQQMIEKAEEYIYEKFNSGLIVSTNIVSFIEGMKQAMKGE